VERTDLSAESILRCLLLKQQLTFHLSEKSTKGALFPEFLKLTQLVLRQADHARQQVIEGAQASPVCPKWQNDLTRQHLGVRVEKRLRGRKNDVERSRWLQGVCLGLGSNITWRGWHASVRVSLQVRPGKRLEWHMESPCDARPWPELGQIDQKAVKQVIISASSTSRSLAAQSLSLEIN